MPRSAGALGIVVAIASAGCAAGVSWMPLEVGRTWRYHLYDARGGEVVILRVEGRCRVGTTDGFKLATESGESRMAWSGGRLLVSELPVVRFNPPVPLLDPQSPISQRKWRGTCFSRGITEKVSATISQRPARLSVGGVERDTLLTVFEMTFRGQLLELKTWFADGVGIIRQEQSVNGKRLVALEWIGGS